MKTQNTYSKQTAKFIASLVQSMPELSSRTMQSLIENPKMLNESLTEALSPFRKVFKTIKIGTGLRSISDLRTALERKGYRAHFLDEKLRDAGFEKSFVESEQEIDVVIVHAIELATEEELCGKEIAREEFYSRAKKEGLELLTLEEALQLRMQSNNGEFKGSVMLATEMVYKNGGSDTLLCLSVAGEVSQTGVYHVNGGSTSVNSSHSHWAFKKPRK